MSPERVGFAVPGPLSTVSGGYEYARRLLALEPFRHLPLPDGFPDPHPGALAETKAALDGWRGPLLVDGLAYGGFPAELARKLGPRCVVLLHHPLDKEHDVTRAAAAERFHREKNALSFARGVIATSDATARDLRERFGVDSSRLAVAEPGVDPAPRSPVRGDPPSVLSVGAVIPRKGHDLLVDALALLPPDLQYRLDIVGPLGRAPEHEAALRRRLVETGLCDRVALVGAVSNTALDAAYRRADLAVLPSRYEGFGMAATEAIARGLPLVAGRGGALAETARVGVLVDVEDREAFAGALRPLIQDHDARRIAAEEAWGAASALPSWEETARSVRSALTRFFADEEGIDRGI